LPVDCLTRDDSGKPVLQYTDSKNNRPNRRLPIAEASAQIIVDQQADVRQRFPDIDDRRLVLFPKDHQNRQGIKPVSEPAFGKLHRDSSTRSPTNLAPPCADPTVSSVKSGLAREPSFRIPTGTATRNGTLTKVLRQMCCAT
jgi:hypothetical protein